MRVAAAFARGDDAPPMAESAKTSRSVPLALLALAGPLIASMISRTVMSLVDFLMVSRLGVDAQAAMLPATLAVFCLIGFGMGAMMAVNTYVAQSFGRDRLEDCGAYAWQGVYLSAAYGAALMPLYFFVEPFFAVVNHAPAVAVIEVEYTRVRMLGLIPAALSFPLTNFFTGIHRPGVGFIAAAVSNAFNIVANYALIFGHFGFESMGVAGAAHATNLAFCVQCAILLAWMVLSPSAARFHTRTAWRVDVKRMINLMRIGTPIGIHLMCDILMWSSFSLFLLGRFGAVQLAASNICLKLLELSFMPALGVAEALSSAVGKAIGRGDVSLAEDYVRWARRINVGYMGAIGLTLVLFPRPFLAPFTDDPEVIAVARTALIFCASFQVFDATQLTMAGALRGAGDTRWPAVAAATCAVVFLIGGGAAVIHWFPQWQSFGPWGAATVYIAALSAALTWRYRFGPWRTLDLHGRDESASIMD